MAAGPKAVTQVSPLGPHLKHTARRHIPAYFAEPKAEVPSTQVADPSDLAPTTDGAAVSPSTPQHTAEQAQPSKAEVTVAFTLAHRVEYGEHICLVGEVESLGSWNSESGIAMSWQEGDLWTAQCVLPAGQSVQYKYVIDKPDAQAVDWQACANLVLDLPDDSSHKVYVYDDWSGAAHEVHVDDDNIQAPQGMYGTIDIDMEEHEATWPAMMQQMEEAVAPHETAVSDKGNGNNDAAAEEDGAGNVLNTALSGGAGRG